MCGGFALYENIDFGERFKVKLTNPTIRYNIRPTNFSSVVNLKDTQRTVSEKRFGMIPIWAKDISIGYKLFNARSETLFEKPVWKRVAKSKRCLVPANGFFEWKNISGKKQPLYIFPKDQTIFSFAGIYDDWKHPETNEDISSFSIITTTPNKELSSVHDRMPVILDEESEDLWLNEESEDLLRELLIPYPNGMIDMYEVSTLVNSAKNQGPEIISPIN